MKSGTSFERATNLKASDIIMTETPRYLLFRDLEIIRHGNFWDGPISGWLTLKEDGKQYFFDQFTALEYLDYSFPEEGAFEVEGARIYAIYEMTAEQIEFSRKSNEIWCDYVGTHCEYKDGRRVLGSPPRIEYNMEKYNELRAALGDYPASTKKYIKGWFIW